MGRRGLPVVLLFLILLSPLPATFAGTLLKLNAGTFDPTQTNLAIPIFEGTGVLNTTNPIAPPVATPLPRPKPSNTAQEYILQYSRPILPQDRELLISQFQLFGYLPDDALVVRATLPELQTFQASHSEVRSIVPYLAKFKVSSELSAISVFNRGEQVSVVVSVFDASENQKLADEILNKYPEVKLEEIYGKHLLITAPRELLWQIAELTGVEHLESAPEMELYDYQGVNPTPAEFDHWTGYEDGTKLVHFSTAWRQGFHGERQIIAMADTGVDSGNQQTIIPDLQGAILQGQAFGEKSDSWADPMGHGTHVAGLLVGRGRSSQGLVRGGAYAASLIAGSMWSASLRNITVPAKLSQLFDAAYGVGARVHSNSWGSNKDPGAYDNSAEQVDEWTHAHPDMLVVFAAGNNGVDANRDGRVDASSLGTPGTAKNCLTVGASKNFLSQGGIQGPIGRMRDGATLWPAEPLASSSMSDNAKGLAAFSSRGPTRDGRLKPDIVAPGTNILGTKSHQSGASSLWGFFNRDYTWSGGTSMAAPLAASAALVTRQILIEKWKIAQPSAALVKAALLHSAEDLFPGQFGAVGAARGQELLTHRPNFDEGFGRVNLQKLLALQKFHFAQGIHFGTQMIDNRRGVGQGEKVQYIWSVPQAADLLVNLVWTDAPGSVNAAQALVNDLDLQLRYPDGRVWRSQDHVNNQESLEVLGLKPGIYELTVSGSRVPEGIANKQSYALIYSLVEHRRSP